MSSFHLKLLTLNRLLHRSVSCDAQDTEEGPYRICDTEVDITNCVDIELKVLAV